MATKRPKYRMNKVQIDFLSACDRPAMEGAVAVLRKRDEELAKRMPSVGDDEKEDDYVSRFMGDEKMRSEFEDEKQRAAVAHQHYRDSREKMGKMYPEGWADPRPTTIVDGHQHVLDGSLSANSGTTSWEKSEGEENGHQHAWLRKPDGSIEILMTEGHVHEVLTMPASVAGEKGAESGAGSGAEYGEGEAMAKDEGIDKGSPELIQLRKDLTETRAQLDVSRVEAQFNDAERSLYAKLDDAGRVEFRKLDADGRKARVEQARGENPVVYTSEAGDVFRKSDDSRLIAMAKRADAETRQARADREALVLERLQKRADSELSHLPGKTEVKVALLKAIDGISDPDLKTGAVALLKAGDENLAKAFRTAGSLGLSIDENSPKAKLEKMAKTLASEKNVSREKGMALALATSEGQQLACAMEAQ